MHVDQLIVGETVLTRIDDQGCSRCLKSLLLVNLNHLVKLVLFAEISIMN